MASACCCELIQISHKSCKVISSETEICKLCLEVQVNRWLQMLRECEKDEFEPWVRSFPVDSASECGWRRQPWEPLWSSVPSRVSVFRWEGLRQGWVQRRVARLIKGQAYRGKRLQWHSLFVLPKWRAIYARRQCWFRNKWALSDPENSECNFF